MKDSRPAIPADLRRRVLLEAGHRCAIHTCQHPDVDVHHIVPWHKCREHAFENLIALCPNCHRRAEAGEIDQRSLRLYKNRLATIFHFQNVDPQFMQPLVQEHASSNGWMVETLAEQVEKKPSYGVEIEYPQLCPASDGPYDEINAVIRGCVFRELLTFRSVPWSELKSRYGGDEEFLPTCSLTGSYEFSILTDNVVSFRLAFTSYTGGAHSSTSFKSLNFQLAPKTHAIELWSLFRDTYKGVKLLSEFCTSELTRIFGEHGVTDSIAEGAGAEIENFRHFNIHKHGISVDFREYQLGCYAMGTPSVFVPYSAISSALNPYCAVIELASA